MSGLISLTAACPADLVTAANSMCLAFGSEGSQYTFGTVWRTADGATETHSVCHAWVAPGLPAALQAGELPADLPADADPALALAALAALHWWEAGDPAPPLDRLILSTAGQPIVLLASWGLSVLEVEG